MRASYGYEDATGFYFITIDTDNCATCEDKKCITACKEEVYEIVKDDWEEVVVAVKENKVYLLKACCESCTQLSAKSGERPCIQACSEAALAFTW